MTLRDPLAFAGRVELRAFESDCLRDNPLGDPHVRDVPVYLPPDASGEPGADGPLPVVFLLAGFTGRGQSYLETHPWKRGVVSRFDRLVATGEAPPAILVMPDCFTRLGGSQYVDSSATGRYADYVAGELVRFVDATFATEPGRRAVVGKSSGGFGAMHLTLRHPGVFRAAASISGDCHFEAGYASQLRPALRHLMKFDGDPARFLEAFLERPDLAGDAHAAINLLAMSACYSPNPASALGFDLPVDPYTGERVAEVWERWLEFDPVHAAQRHAEAWRQLDLLYLECGRYDEFDLQFGLRVLVRELERLGVPHEHVEWEGGHFGTDDRYLEVLPRVIGALRA